MTGEQGKCRRCGVARHPARRVGRGTRAATVLDPLRVEDRGAQRSVPAGAGAGGRPAVVVRWSRAAWALLVTVSR